MADKPNPKDVSTGAGKFTQGEAWAEGLFTCDSRWIWVDSMMLSAVKGATQRLMESHPRKLIRISITVEDKHDGE